MSANQYRASSPVPEPPENATILIVDDEPSNRELIDAVLQRESYRLVYAVDGPSALAQVAAQPIDLILLDVRMPGMDGYEVCRQLKSDPGRPFVPIVLVTAVQGPDERLKGVAAGADDFLSMPFSPVELITRVRSLLRLKRLHDELERSKHRLEIQVAERTAQLRQALAELQELDRLRSQFISSVSHELRTPLMYVKGWVDLLAEGALGALTEDQAQAVARAQQGARQLTRMIENVLDFGQLRVASLQLQPVHLAEIAGDVAAALSSSATERQVALVVSVPDDLPAIKADPHHLEKVLRELVDNAIKFSPPQGRVQVVASYGGAPSPSTGHRPGYVLISVSDEGPGIPPGRLQDIFSPFVQLDGSTTRQHRGAGLGLALVALILAGHGSEIQVSSQVGQGSTFYFSLPIVEIPSEPAQ